MNIKLLYSISALCLIASISMAQITVDSTDMPSIGDTAVMGIDTAAPAGLLVLGTGAQTWDFTSIQVDEFDTMIFVDPSTTPYGADFPTANLAQVGATNTYQTLDTNALITVGQAGDDPFGAGATVSAAFSPTQTIITLPSTDGTAFSDTSGFDQTIETASLGLPVPNVDSIRLVHSSRVTSVFDAYGDVTTAAGTFASIRQLYTDETVDSIFAYCSDPAGCNVFVATLPFGWGFVPTQVTQLIVGLDNPALDTTYTYKWWANGEDVPVAEVETDAPGGTAVSAMYKLGNEVIALADGSTNALCKDSCDGTASVTSLGGTGTLTYVWDDPAAQSTATATGLCAGTYNAYIVDAVADTSVTVSVTVGEPTALGIIITTTPALGDTTGIVTALVTGGTNPYFYVWSTTPPQTTASAINLVPGTYTVIVTDGNGCIAVDSGTVPVDTSVGIVYAASYDYINLYPNPVTNELFVSTELEQNAWFVAYNIVGKKVINVAIDNKFDTINTSDLANGMYVFQLIDEEGRVIQLGKFTVER
ncbi:MAG TPA: T9SS type A sorting domain-containing protein [Flavobacteriales bacterium]|nr:T9SS type A sorting domain-containing protein [Flavobacteriales bacterium]HIO68274.1 T9SS type A sorting domain-containing protein [Flavobacteriales bacterium]